MTTATANGSPNIALIHATLAAVQPARSAFAERFPAATLWNLLDDRLITEAERAGGLTAALRHRMHSLIRYAVDGGAEAVLLSCSMYGPVVDDAAATCPVPVLASDQALFGAVADTVTRSGARRIAVFGPIQAGVDDTVARLRGRLAEDVDSDVTIEGTVVDGVREAADDAARLDQLVAEQARRIAPSVDVIVLGQFTIAPAQHAAQAAVGVPVLSPPQLAADALRAVLAERAPA